MCEDISDIRMKAEWTIKPVTGVNSRKSIIWKVMSSPYT